MGMAWYCYISQMLHGHTIHRQWSNTTAKEIWCQSVFCIRDRLWKFRHWRYDTACNHSTLLYRYCYFQHILTNYIYCSSKLISERTSISSKWKILGMTGILGYVKPDGQQVAPHHFNDPLAWGHIGSCFHGRRKLFVLRMWSEHVVAAVQTKRNSKNSELNDVSFHLFLVSWQGYHAGRQKLCMPPHCYVSNKLYVFTF